MLRFCCLFITRSSCVLRNSAPVPFSHFIASFLHYKGKREQSYLLLAETSHVGRPENELIRSSVYLNITNILLIYSGSHLCSLFVISPTETIIRNLPEEHVHGRLHFFCKDKQNSFRAFSERHVYITVIGLSQSVAIQSAKCEQNSSAPLP